MADPIEAHYTPDGDDWTVAVKGRGRTLTGRAPGLIAARDRADQLVEQIAPEESGRKTVVHLLNGDAVEFTTAYLTARLARTEEPAPAEEETPAGATAKAPDAPGQETGGQTAEETGGRQAATGSRHAASPEATGGRRAAAGAEAAVPVPAKSAEGAPPAAATPTPHPRPEPQVAQPATAAAETPAEETTPSGS